MRLVEIVKLLNATVFTKNSYNEDYVIKYAFSGDLMSDALMVLRNAPSEFFLNGALVTGNVTIQSVRTAEILDFPVIIMTRDKIPTNQVIDQAEKSNIILLGTKDVMFTASGKLYKNQILGYTDVVEA
jgi:hypothetical protein